VRQRLDAESWSSREDDIELQKRKQDDEQSSQGQHDVDDD